MGEQMDNRCDGPKHVVIAHNEGPQECKYRLSGNFILPHSRVLQEKIGCARKKTVRGKDHSYWSDVWRMGWKFESNENEIKMPIDR